MPDAVEGADIFSNRKIKNAMFAFRKDLSELAHSHAYPGRRREDAILALQSKMARLKCPDVDPADLLDHMLEQKVICIVKGLIVPAWRSKKRTPEEAQAAYDKFVADISTRATDDVQAQARLARLIRRATRLHAVHRIQTPNGQGVFIASRMEYVCGEPAVTKGTAFVIEKDRVAVYPDIIGNMLKLDWIDDHPRFQINLEGAYLDGGSTQRLGLSRLVKDNGNPILGTTASDSHWALKCLLKDREALQAYIGAELNHHRWSSLSMSLNRHKNIRRTAQLVLAGMLDPDLRRVALRNPFATYDFYFWLGNADEEALRRRIQMSDAYPLFTCYMKQLDEVIRTGAPLLPVLQKITGLDIQRLKRLRGVHWQRLGRAVRHLISEDKPLMMVLLQAVEPFRMPKSRTEWVAFSDILQWDLLALISEKKKRGALEAMSRNWIGYQELIEKDLLQALGDTAENLVPLIDHHFSTRTRPHQLKRRLMEKILAHIAGDNFGLKRLRQFNESWHKGTGQRSVRLRALRKKVFGEDTTANWKPLTETFQCAEGKMVWLTDELALLDEGRLMGHCVGSYWHACVEGVSHIAQVLATDETRSTVEIRISGTGKAVVQQNHTYKNNSPSNACQAIVSKFLKTHRKTKFQVVRGEAGSRYTTRREMVQQPIIDELKDIYSDCLPRDFMDDLETEYAVWRATNVRMSVEEYERLAREKTHAEWSVKPRPKPTLPLPASVNEDEDDKWEEAYLRAAVG
jgi:hypothetical protein